MAAGAALAAKRGRLSKRILRGASRGMYESMSVSDLRHMARSKRKGKPVQARKSRNGRRRRRRSQ
jgi:hypothetical protein